MEEWERKYKEGLDEYHRMFGGPNPDKSYSYAALSPLWDDVGRYLKDEEDTRPLAKVLPFRPRRAR